MKYFGRIILFTMVFWLAFSYCEIIVKNVRPNPDYTKMNAFVLFKNLKENN